MITVPAHELNIVILVNGALVSANALAKKFIDLILGDVLTAPSVIADAARFGHLHGTHYQGASGLRLGFERAGESMGASFLGYPALPILRVDGDTLCAPFEDVALGPLTLDARALSPDDTGAAPQRITLAESGYPEELMLLAPLTPEQALAACEGLVGHYASWDLNARAEVRRDGEDYVLFIQGEYGAKRPLQLAALSADAFTAKDDSASVAVLAQREAGEVVGLQFDSVRARRLMFSRVAA
jgi:hypothetical protein